MIYIRLQGHSYEYEVGELVKLFYFNREIKFVDDKTLVDCQGLLIENILTNVENTYDVETKIYEGNRILSSYRIENVNNVDVKEGNIDKRVKIAIKQSIYKGISQVSSVNAPWGILTGIRPTKIVHDLFDKGYKKETIFNTLTTQYLLNEEKAKLILNIAIKERKFLYPMDENRFSLYISIPFCPSRCLYCSFPSNSLEKWGSLVDEYTEKLLYEIDEVGKLLKRKKINSVYIGGGTPTAIPVVNLEKIIKKVYELFNRDEIKEFTVEAGRPDTATEAMLMMLKENSIDRISINPQTMNRQTLGLIGRKHEPNDVVDAYHLARRIGFESINMDIIIGLPNEDEKDIIDTMEKILEMSPENLTVHTMAVKRASKLKENVEDFSLAQQRTIEVMLEITKNYTEKMDMEPYYMYRQKQILGNFENVGYSKPGKECIYNMAIMEEKETIIALGAGGISKMFYPSENRFERIPNVKSLQSYIDRVDEMVKRKKNFLETS